jgi:hypothetical protein
VKNTAIPTAASTIARIAQSTGFTGGTLLR